MSRVLFAAALAIAAPASAQTIKLGTLAPEGSGWHKLLKDQAAKWEQVSGGKVKLKIYAGGTLGNEGDMVRKMRVGQLQAAAVSVVGIGDVDTAAKAICAPGFAADDAEFLWMMDRMAPVFARRLEEKGFVVLGFGDMGWARLFFSKDVRSPSTAAGVKIFTWSGDPGAQESWRAVGFQPVVISATDILPSLSTGMIDGFANTPILAMTARLYEGAKFMPDVAWGRMAGVTVVTKEAWERIPAEIRPALLQASQETTRLVNAEVGRMTRDAMDVMQKNGLRVMPLNEYQRSEWQKAQDKVFPLLRGTAFPADVADEARKLRDDHRAGKVK